jgi:hypothetical protein
MGILEKSLEEDIVRRNRARTGPPASPGVSDPLTRQKETYSEDEEEKDTKGLRSSDYAREYAAYFEDEERDDDIVDLGIALGKLRITERIGGLVRPKFSDEVSTSMLLIGQANAISAARASLERATQETS